MIEKLFKKMHQEYGHLRIVNSNHELLRYFTDTKEGFSMNKNTEIGVEFVERFKAGMPDLEQLKKQEKKISYEEYKQKLLSSLYGNYLSALEQAISEKASSN